MKTIILYFSGTGNSLFIAQKIAEQLGETELSPIIEAKHLSIAQYDRIGFVFPVYYLHSPNIVMNILQEIELKPQQKIFLVASFAGSWGYALSDLQKTLSQKADFIQAFRIRMPGNYLLEYGAAPLFLQKSLLKKAEKTIRRITNDIRDEKPVLNLSPNLTAWIFKNAAADKEEDFNKLGTQFYTEKNCKHCGICSELCPVDNIIVENNEIKWGRYCQQCMACIQWCPHNAIMHPNYKQKRKRYVNPKISIKDFL